MGTTRRERPSLPHSLVDGRIVAVLRGLAQDQLLPVAESMVSNGLKVIEVTMDTPNAVEMIRALASGDAGPITVGAGTVISREDAASAVAAGAEFLVAPHTDPEIVQWAVDRDIAIVPGALTPTEVATAWRLGATCVKIFPADLHGARYLRALSTTLAGIPLMATGGVTDATIAEYLAAGACIVGAGSWLIGNGESEGVGQRTASLLEAST